MLNWLFEIGPTASPTYRLALADMTYNSNAYTGVVDPESFSGVTLNRVKVELDQITRSEISFNIVGSYTLSALIGQPLVIREVTGSDVADMLGAWRFRIESAASAYGVITVTAVDQLSSVMDGVWPNTPLVRNVFPEAVFSHAGLDESACIPVVFGGSSYIPVQSKSVSGEVFFIIGTGAGGSHTITAITSPNNIDSPISYTVNTDIWVEGSSDGTYEFFQPFREVGLVTPVFWRSGADRAAPFVQYSKTGMSGYTNPVDILRYVLEDCGIASVDFDSTWDSVATAVDARGYTYSRGFYQYTDRPKLICHLLAACDCNIYQSGNRVSIALNSKTSVTTVDSSDVIKTRMEDHGDFSWDRVLPAKNDSGEINYFTHGTPQTKLIKAIVTASGTTTTPSTDTLDIGGVSSSTAAQKLGTLYYLKKYCRNGECSFTGRPDLISLVPGQVVTINDTLYGPSVTALVESVRINRDSTVKVTCSTYSTAFVDFEDLSATAISPVLDTAAGAITTLSQATSYTDSELENFDPPDTSTWNNRNDTAITAPTISGSGTAVDHVINTDGSANISFEWSWSGDEAVIDGFQVYWYASSSASTYTFGTDTANEQTAPVLPDCRAIICPSVAANKYYSFAVRAYRKVDPDISASGLITSTRVSPSLGSENPYLPSATVAFAGDITGTLNGTSVATVVSNAGTGATHAGTAHAPSNADVTQVVLNAGAAIDNAKVNGQTLIVGGYINTNVLQVSSTMIVGSLDWSTQISGTGKPENGATVGAPVGTYVGSVAAATVATAATNFNNSNDRNASAITNPTISTSGTAIDHTANTDGSVNISFEWSWGGDEGVIDGFFVYLYSSSSSSSYTFGTDLQAEVLHTVSAKARAYIWHGMPANKYYTFGIQAYRSVDKDINSIGVIKSSLVQPALGSENPYLPSASVAFSGDITGTLNGTSVATVVTNAGTGATHAGTAHAPSNADATTTVIAGGIITTGTVQVYNGTSGLTAGISGNGVGDSYVRIWAGASLANRDSAPFRVTQAGAVTCSNITITGGSIGSAATISGTAASTVVSQASAGSYHASSVAHAPADADKTANNTAYDTARVYGIAASTIAGWKYAGQTYIDGGKIWTGTVTAYQIAANTITLDRLYAGDTGSITFTGCQMTFGNGADLILQSTTDLAAVLTFNYSYYNYDIRIGNYGGSNYLCIGARHTDSSLLLGDPTSTTPYRYIESRAYDTITLRAYGSSSEWSTVTVRPNTINFHITSGGLQRDVSLSTSALICSQLDLGSTSYPCYNIYSQKAYVSDELMLGSTGASGVSRVKSLGRGTGTTTYGWVHQNSSSQTRFQVRDDGEVLSGHHSPVANDTYYCGTSTAARWAGAYIAYANVVGMNPPTANTGYVGSSTNYYADCKFYHIYYHGSDPFDSMDDLEVIHSIGPVTDESGKPVLHDTKKYGCKAKPMTEIHPAITNYSQLADELNEEYGTKLTFEDLQDIVSGKAGPVQVKEVELYVEDFTERGAAAKYAHRLDGRIHEIDQLMAGEIEGPVVIQGPLIDREFIEGCVFFNAGATAQLSLGGLRQLDNYITEDVLEQVNALIESLTTRLAAVETILTRRIGSGETTGLNN